MDIDKEREKIGKFIKAGLLGLSIVLLVGCSVMYLPKIVTVFQEEKPKENLPINSVDCNDKKLALSFDVSGSNDKIDNILEVLESLGIKATFFMTGDWIDEHADEVRVIYRKGHDIGNRSLRNHNKLLWLYPGADGVKTGFTKAAGRILVSSATKNRRRLVAVTINDPDDWRDHAALLDQGFSKYNYQRIVTVGDCVGYREIAGGNPARVSVLAAENFVYSVSKDESPQLLLPGSGFIYAPAVEGADAGYAYVILSGKAVGKVPVVYGETSEIIQQPQKKSSRFLFWRKEE